MVIMSRDTLSIGSTPYGEDCAQVGSTEYDYATRARAECKAFMQQIAKHYPEPDNGYLKIKANPHDFGTYHELVIVYDDQALDELSKSNPALLDRFWEWEAEAESLDLESLEVLAEISEAWYLYNYEKNLKPLKSN